MQWQEGHTQRWQVGEGHVEQGRGTGHSYLGGREPTAPAPLPGPRPGEQRNARPLPRAAAWPASVSPPPPRALAPSGPQRTYPGAAPQELSHLLQGTGAGCDRVVGLLLHRVPGVGVEGREDQGAGSRKGG